VSDPANIVIVGGGECGARAAASLREHGFTGSVTIVGSEPHAPYERPPLSKTVLTDSGTPSPTTIISKLRADELDLALITGATVESIDRQARTVALVDGRCLPYDKVLLATGARARPVPVIGGSHAMTFRSYDDALQVRPRLTPGARVGVIGAGFVGLEVASSAAEVGCHVTVVEIGERSMGRAVPPEIGALIEARHRQAGVTLRFGVTVEALEADSDTQVLRLSAGESIVCDVVVAGIGVLPNTDLAAAAGLTIDNGIAVDASLRTDDPDIFAGGDCCSFPHPLFDDRRVRLEAWRNAQEHGNIAAANMLGGNETCTAVPWFWTDHYELGLQIAGLPDAAVVEVTRQRADGATVRFGLDAEGRLVCASGVASGTSIARDIRLAEMLIAQRAHPTLEELADPAVSLKSLLAIVRSS
jgi:3-phenylpropionate/trans-cinnamate dioxygenase ferredoxin reductase component